MGLSWVHRSELWLPPLCALFRHRVILGRQILSLKILNQRKKFLYICYMMINPLPHCMHYVTCVKCIQEFLVSHSSLSFKAGSCHGAGSVITGDTVVWHNDNFRCRHWRRGCHLGCYRFSVLHTDSRDYLCLNQIVVGYRHALFSIYLAEFILQGIQKRRPMAGS